MKIISIKVPRTHNFYLVSDTHEGSKLQHTEGLLKTINNIKKDKKAVFAHLGDEIEGITVDDPRYHRSTENPGSALPLDQCNAVVEMFEPIKKKGMVWLDGNHPLKLRKFGELTKDVVCARLGIEHGTYTCKVHVHDMKGNLMYKMFLSHGFRSINSTAADPADREAAMLRALKRGFWRKASDCMIMAMGHTHKLLVKPPISELYLTDDGDRVRSSYTSTPQVAEFINPDLRWYVNTGSFYKLYELGVSGYAEQAGYDPNELGHAIVRVEDGTIKTVDRVIYD